MENQEETEQLKMLHEFVRTNGQNITGSVQSDDPSRDIATRAELLDIVRRVYAWRKGKIPSDDEQIALFRDIESAVLTEQEWEYSRD